MGHVQIVYDELGNPIALLFPHPGIYSAAIEVPDELADLSVGDFVNGVRVDTQSEPHRLVKKG
jgi:hypothetical protein